jgi:hypothetical protein
MSEDDYAGLIAAAHQQLHAPIILIWDNLNTHTSAVMRRFLDAHPDWLTVVRLPGCRVGGGNLTLRPPLIRT